MAWTWDSGKRRDSRLISPVSIRSTPSATCQRVTSQLTTPAQTAIPTTMPLPTRSLPVPF